MNRSIQLLLLLQLAGLFVTTRTAFADTAKRCAVFNLRDSKGQVHTLSDSKTPFKVVAFLGTECPLAKLYSQRLNEIALEYREQLSIIGVNSNCQDSNSDIANFVRRYELRFPLLKDLRNEVADQLEAQRTPEVFLLDAENQIRYRGRIDDQYGVGYARAKPTRSELREAIEALIAGKEVPIHRTEAVGCFIGRIPTKPAGDQDSDVVYSEQIVPILEKHCVKCHQEGEIAPFSLTSYDEVIGWGETIREVIDERRMPPWHANPEFGEFTNSRSMPEHEKELVKRWIAVGMPKGDSDREPKVSNRVAGWRLPGDPDAVFFMSKAGFQVPAEGTVEYQYFVVDPQLKEDRWVSAAEVIPGNRSVVHHAIVFVRPPQGERQEGIGWLTAYVPGQSVMALPDGLARRVPAGSKFVFQMHYTPTGTPAKDKTKIGLIFANGDDIHTEVQTRVVIDRDFEIPAHAANYVVEMFADKFPAGSTLLAISPHMHYRGSRFQVSAFSNTGFDETATDSTKILLDVPNYDFNWQHAYLLKENLPLENVRIDCRAEFNNSASNLVNPDPTAKVRWGDQTWEEMALAYLAIAVPLNSKKTGHTDGAKILSERKSDRKTTDLDPKARQLLAEQIAKEFFDKLDENEDGEILRAETPSSFRVFAWYDYDQNGDDKLTWEEVLQQARLTLRR